eukprot:TRINITY_DN870_c0_g1_i10.p3 TRINITY_DN870_c0_g1~~TRINITY_DN870_c0_g1_i10.p3  ORF type:complete len:110 (+),score=19.59 TRINITY_DN870_c0_g1_i10:155-484(+)
MKRSSVSLLHTCLEIHAMKHYPQWDFRSYETHTDIYAHWNEYTPVYYGTDTYPIEGDRWDKGSKIINSQIPFLIFSAVIFFSWARKRRRRNVLLYPPRLKSRMNTLANL